MYAGTEDLLPRVEDAVRVTQDNDIDVVLSLAFARYMYNTSRSVFLQLKIKHSQLVKKSVVGENSTCFKLQFKNAVEFFGESNCARIIFGRPALPMGIHNVYQKDVTRVGSASKGFKY